jgi:hypothetical protein
MRQKCALVVIERFPDRKAPHVLPPNAGRRLQGRGLSARAAGAHVYFAVALCRWAAPAAPFDYAGAVRRAYLDNPVAQRAVRLVAEGIGGAPLLPTDPIWPRWSARPAPGSRCSKRWRAQLLLHGNAYVQVIKDGAGRPVELFALRPERVSVIAGQDGWPAAYAYRSASGADASRCWMKTPRPT